MKKMMLALVVFLGVGIAWADYTREQAELIYMGACSQQQTAIDEDTAAHNAYWFTVDWYTNTSDWLDNSCHLLDEWEANYYYGKLQSAANKIGQAESEMTWGDQFLAEADTEGTLCGGYYVNSNWNALYTETLTFYERANSATTRYRNVYLFPGYSGCPLANGLLAEIDSFLAGF